MESRLCFICQRNPIAGRVARYDIEVCRDCWENNWNGWAKQHEAAHRPTLEGEGIGGAGAECVRAISAGVTSAASSG